MVNSDRVISQEDVLQGKGRVPVAGVLLRLEKFVFQHLFCKICCLGVGVLRESGVPYLVFGRDYIGLKVA